MQWQYSCFESPGASTTDITDMHGHLTEKEKEQNEQKEQKKKGRRKENGLWSPKYPISSLSLALFPSPFPNDDR